MLGLINRGLRAFVIKFHGRSHWQELVATQPEVPSDFEVLMDYPLSMTELLISEISELRGTSQRDVMEDLGTFALTSFWDARLRDLLLSCGRDFDQFMQNLTDLLIGFSRVEQSCDIERIEVIEKIESHYEVRFRGSTGMASYLVLGLFRALADQYGALVTCSHRNVLSDGEPFDVFTVLIFEKGESGFNAAEARSGEGLREYFRAEILQLILDEARGLIGRLDSARAMAQRRANIDPLTGLLNRRGLSAWWHENERALGSLTLVHIDLDHFKPVNDEFGHATGDALLQIVAQRLKNISRQDDGVARLGGDEFLFVAQAPSRKVVDEICKRVQAIFERPVSFTTHSLQVGASMGCVWQKGQEMSLNTLIQVADAALYRAKAQGRGRLIVHELGQAAA